MLMEEGLENVFARHDRLAEATRRAVRAWNLELLCLNPQEYSSSVTAVLMPEGHDADAFRKLVLGKFNLSLGNGLGKLQGKVFRIGHLGDFNDLMLAGTLSGLEMGLALAGVPFHKRRRAGGPRLPHRRVTFLEIRMNFFVKIPGQVRERNTAIERVSRPANQTLSRSGHLFRPD